VFKLIDIQSKFWVSVDYKISNIGLVAFIKNDGQELPSVGKAFGVESSFGKLSKFVFRR